MDGDAHLPEQYPRDRPDRHAGRRLARGRPLEDVAQISLTVLHAARQVGMPGRGLVTAGSLSGPVMESRSSQLGRSRFTITMVTGAPVVTPPRSPEVNSTSSHSIPIRAPRP